MTNTHIEAKTGAMAKCVLMPGDPLRAKYIAENYLEGAIQFNSVRNVLGYTGTFQGHRVSVMASGMGMPSMGIYAYELYNFYGVDTIIRIGSCGSYSEALNIGQVLLATEAFSESSFARVQSGETSDTLFPSNELLQHIVQVSEALNIHLDQGAIHSSDVFYRLNEHIPACVKEKSLVAVEMESFALFNIAKCLNKSAAALLTATDSMLTQESLSSHARESSLNDMITLALHAAVTWQDS